MKEGFFVSDETTVTTTPTKQRPRRRRPQRKNNQPAATVQKPVAKAAQNTSEGAEKKATNQRHRRPRRRPKKTTTPDAQTVKPVAKKPVAKPAAAKAKTAVAQTTTKPAPASAPVIKKDVTKAFVDHETESLTIAPRRALHVYVRNLRQVRQLRRFGDVDYVSKKLHYVVIYMNEADVSANRLALNKLPFVRRVVDSARPDVDPYVGHGVNANFVTHTQDDGAADAVVKAAPVEDED